jgi:peptidoglycan/xylan/chitin deacetylase (PgdA/CDA1 family)
MRLSLLLFLLVWVASPLVVAAPLATIDRSQWSDSLASHPGFNQASRREILDFAAELLVSEMIAPDEWPQRLELPNVDVMSIERYRSQTWLRLLAAYQAANRECRQCPHPASVSEFRHLVMQPHNVPPRLQAAYAASRRFHAVYLLEQLRLAARFPEHSSEIDTLSADELTGHELMDGEFLLTFEGGPGLAAGSTLRTTRVLAKAGQNAVFFLLGDRLAQRLQSSVESLSEEYRDNCIASNGMVGRPYPRIANWRDSLKTSRHLLSQIPDVTRLSWFRPPFGERTAEMNGQIFERIVLWNIDTRDDSAALSEQQVADRLLTLMLLWRKGIVRFHERQSAAADILPKLFVAVQTSPVRWVDCRSFSDH